MIASLTDAEATGRARRLQQALRDSIPATEILYIDPAERPHPRPTEDSLEDVEHAYERAMEAEWSCLIAEIDGQTEMELLNAIAQLSSTSLLVRSDSGDPLGTRVASSRFDAVQAVLEVRAAGVFDAVLTNAPEHGVMVSAIPGSEQDLHFSEPDADGQAPEWASHLAKIFDLRRVVWLTAHDRSVVVDAGGCAVNLDDPLGLEAAMEVLRRPECQLPAVIAARVLLGRQYNRLVRPSSPLEWTSLLSKPTVSNDYANAFVAACDAVLPGSGHALLGLASESLKVEQNRGDGFLSHEQADSVTEADGLPQRPAAPRQLAGRSVSSGEATGRVWRPGTPRPSEESVVVVDRLSPRDTEKLNGAVALVERRGAGFGFGAVQASLRAIPHLYRVRDEATLRGGERIIVNASAGIVTVPGEV